MGNPPNILLLGYMLSNLGKLEGLHQYRECMLRAYAIFQDSCVRLEPI